MVDIKKRGWFFTNDKFAVLPLKIRKKLKKTMLSIK